MNYNFLLNIAKKIILYFWESEEVKVFVIDLLRKYASTTDNDVDDLLVDLVRSKLIKK